MEHTTKTSIPRPDQCPMCGSFSFDAFNADGSRYIPFFGSSLWDKCRCVDCGHVWAFRIVHLVKSEVSNETH